MKDSKNASKTHQAKKGITKSTLILQRKNIIFHFPLSYFFTYFHSNCSSHFLTATMRLLFVSLLIFLGLVVAEQISFDVYANVDEDVDETSLLYQYSKLSNDSLLWGPYRSALYFGVRPRIPRSLLSGLMWFNVDTYNGIGTFRHFYEQGDNMKRANWVQYDPRSGGRQIISDGDCHIDIIIDFIKSEDGNSWGAKIKSIPHKGHENVKTSFVWYSGLEGHSEQDEFGGRSGYFKLDNEKNVVGHDGNIKFSGVSEELGLFTLEINDGPKTNKHPQDNKVIDPELDPTKSHHYSLTVPDDNVWQAKDIFMTMLQESIQQLVDKYSALENFPPEQAFIMRDLHNFEGNLHYVQKIYQGRAEFDVIYTNAVTPDNDKITFENIKLKTKKAIQKFDSKFNQHFAANAPFNSKKYEKFGKEIVSGLLGGLSYFYGDHLVDRQTVFDEDSFESYELVGEYEGPNELLTLVPSRPFFPRGFYWDEGFHLLPLVQYDSDLALEIIKSWFNLMDDEGWIAREQIIGPELRSRVPEQFRVQSPQIVNPPTLILILTYLLEHQKTAGFGDINEPAQAKGYGAADETPFDKEDLGLIIIKNPELFVNYTKEIYPKLKVHFNMFRTTQQGYTEEFDRGTNKEAYRWRGRTLTHSLASGLDDYPRALPADIAELNVDLLSWIGVMARSIKLIAEYLNYEEDLKLYTQIEKDVIDNLNNLHWSQEDNVYCDLSVNEDDENIAVCHKGYISLFPFLTKLMPVEDSEKIEDLVDLISDPDELWSDYGIRSLSKSDKYYGTGENYWRSPVWIHMNYLVLDSLQYYQNAGDYSQELKEKISSTYHQLRVNLVENVFNQWEKTGFVWENYDDLTGEAKGAKNFLGWTSTVAMIMNMPENI